MKKIVLFFFIFAILNPSLALASINISERLSGRILLQVESKGEAWYVNPKDFKRCFLGRPADAFEVMKKNGIGITNNNLSKIPIALVNNKSLDVDGDGLSDDLEVAIGTNKNKKDTDGDGYGDGQELSIGYNPLGAGKILIDNSFTLKNKGKIFLQVEGAGEAWYVNPVDLKRYFLGRPADAFEIMRSLGLGINNIDLEKILIGGTVINSSENINPDKENTRFTISLIEQITHALINEQRIENGLPPLKWNEDLAAVAREHSQNLVEENLSLTDFDKICNYAVIHHEGLVFGLMPANRLNNRGVNYYSRVGENIALIGAAEVDYLIDSLTFDENKIKNCQDQLLEWNSRLRSDMEALNKEEEIILRLKEEISKRKTALNSAEIFKISEVVWKNNQKVSEESVDGWMNSPGHRANILEPEYNEAGIGVAYINGYMILTQVFIKRAACGYVGGSCCEKGGCYLPSVCNSKNNICE